MLMSGIDSILHKFDKKLVPLSRIEVSREKMLANYDRVKKTAKGKEVWPVLKANAYGGGLLTVAEILRARKFKYMAVDSYYEALKIWQVNRQKILLIGPILPANYSKIDWSRVTIMVQSADQVRELSATGKKIKIHLKVNTGMNRQGVEIEEIGAVLEAIKVSGNIELEGLMSHLADADNEDDSFTKVQENNFKKAVEIVKREGLRPKYYHLEATAGVNKIKLPEVNAVRLGLGLYDQALRLVSTIVKVRKVKKGDKVSYGLTYQFREDSWIGVIPVGYYEGLDRRLSNQGVVKYNGEYYPIVGRICMNMCVVNFGKEKPLEYGEVEVIGADGENSFEANAKKCGTINYEMMTRLSSTIKRVVV